MTRYTFNTCFHALRRVVLFFFTFPPKFSVVVVVVDGGWFVSYSSKFQLFESFFYLLFLCCTLVNVNVAFAGHRNTVIVIPRLAIHSHT